MSIHSLATDPSSRPWPNVTVVLGSSVSLLYQHGLRFAGGNTGLLDWHGSCQDTLLNTNLVIGDRSLGGNRSQTSIQIPTVLMVNNTPQHTP